MEVFHTQKYAIELTSNRFVVYDEEESEPEWALKKDERDLGGKLIRIIFRWEEETKIPAWDWALNIFIITVGLCGAVAGTYAAIQELINTSGSDWQPCYAK